MDPALQVAFFVARCPGTFVVLTMFGAGNGGEGGGLGSSAAEPERHSDGRLKVRRVGENDVHMDMIKEMQNMNMMMIERMNEPAAANDDAATAGHVHGDDEQGLPAHECTTASPWRKRSGRSSGYHQ